jgi:hypothetical protein
MSRTIVTRSDLTTGGVEAGLGGVFAPNRKPRASQPGPSAGPMPSLYAPSLPPGRPPQLFPRFSSLSLERGHKKEAELRKQVEEAIREGDEIRAAVLNDIRQDLIRELAWQELQDIYEVEEPSPTNGDEEPPPPQVPAALPQLSPPAGVDGYTSRLLKYIPAESVALYLTLQGLILSGIGTQSPAMWLWITFGIGMVGTPLYLARIVGVSKPIQLAVSTLAFGIWVFALGGAFASLPWYEPFIGSLVLVTFTFFAPLIDPDSRNDSESLLTSP